MVSQTPLMPTLYSWVDYYGWYWLIFLYYYYFFLILSIATFTVLLWNINKVGIKGCTITGVAGMEKKRKKDATLQPKEFPLNLLCFFSATVLLSVTEAETSVSAASFFPLARGSAPLWYVTFVLVCCLCLDTIGPTCSDLLETPQHAPPPGCCVQSFIWLPLKDCHAFTSLLVSPPLIKMQKAAFGRAGEWRAGGASVVAGVYSGEAKERL